MVHRCDENLAKIRNDWVEGIGNAIKAHKELSHKMKVVSEKRKSMVNNRFGGNLSQMVKPCSR